MDKRKMLEKGYGSHSYLSVSRRDDLLLVMANGSAVCPLFLAHPRASLLPGSGWRKAWQKLLS